MRNPVCSGSVERGSVVARISADAQTVQSLGDRLAETLSPDDAAVAQFEANEDWILEIWFRHEPDARSVRALVKELGGTTVAERLLFSKVPERDWVAASLTGLPPVEAGRFVVHGAHDRSRVTPNRIGIEIEAALAFGTGHHGSTHGCLYALDRLLKRWRPRQTLDIGAGSGVLAIAAARATRRPALASDIDPTSVRAAKDNARRNRASRFVMTMRARGASDRRIAARAPFDLVFANILLEPLKRLAQPIAAAVAAGGRVVLSGLLPAQSGAALAAYRAFGLVLERRIVRDGWVTLILEAPLRRHRSSSHRLSTRNNKVARCRGSS